MNKLLKTSLIIILLLTFLLLIVNTVYIQENLKNLTYSDYKISKIGKVSDIFPKKIKALSPITSVKKGEKISSIQGDDVDEALWQNRKYIGFV